MSERVPPHDLDAEQSVLGSIMLDPDALAKVVPILRPEHFYRENHAAVYRAARDLFMAGEPIDVVTVHAQLEKMGLADRVGGRTSLLMLAESTPTAANIPHYAELVLERATKRFAIQYATEVVGKGFDDTVPASDLVAQFQRAAFGLAEGTMPSEPEKVGKLLPAFFDRLDPDQEHESGISTGFGTVDHYLNGMRGGDLIVVAGRASMGKTAWALNVALRVAKAGHAVAIFSLEMQKEQVVDRLVAQEARVDKERLLKRQLSDEEMDRVMRVSGPLGDAPLYIDEQNAIDEMTLAAKVRQLAIKTQDRGGLRLVVVDYLQLMRSSVNWKDNRVREVGYIAQAMKNLAREMRLPVMVAAQFNRAPDGRSDKRPALSDLRESGDIENHADVVIGLFRPEYYDPAESPGVAEALVLKNRNGATGKAKLRFKQEWTRFDDFDNHHTHPDE